MRSVAYSESAPEKQTLLDYSPDSAAMTNCVIDKQAVPAIAGKSDDILLYSGSNYRPDSNTIFNLKNMYDVLKEGGSKLREIVSDHWLPSRITKSALIKGGFGMSPKGITDYLRNSGFEVTNDYFGVDEYTDYSNCDAVIHLYFRSDGTAHYVAGISNGDGTFCFYNSDADSTEPMTWKRYFEKANNNTHIMYNCTYKIKKKE